VVVGFGAGHRGLRHPVVLDAVEKATGAGKKATSFRASTALIIVQAVMIAPRHQAKVAEPIVGLVIVDVV